MVDGLIDGQVRSWLMGWLSDIIVSRVEWLTDGIADQGLIDGIVD